MSNAVSKKLKIENIVLEGGGVKGIAYAGMFQMIEELDLLRNLQRVAGSSVGALAALILALGYTSKEANDILVKLNLSELQDADMSIFMELLSNYGICKGNKLSSFIEGIIQEKTGKKDTTFRELFLLRDTELKKNGTTKLKKLYVTAVNLETCRTEIFSHESKYLDIPIAIAIRASVSIPIFFSAVKIPPGSHGQGGLFVDGALCWQYPIDIFDKSKYLPELGIRDPEFHVTNFRTLGFKVDSPEEIYGYFKTPKQRKIHGLYDFAYQLTKMIARQKRDIQARNFSLDKYRTVFCNVGNAGTVDFSMSSEKKKALFIRGEIAVLDFINRYSAKLLELQQRYNTAAVTTEVGIQASLTDILASISSSDSLRFICEGGSICMLPQPCPVALTTLSAATSYRAPSPQEFLRFTGPALPTCASTLYFDPTLYPPEAPGHRYSTIGF